MLKNYFIIAFRNIGKHKFYSAINIFGMAAGITACLLIILWVSEELSYDKFHEKADRIYQIGLTGKIGDQQIRTATTCSPMAATLVAEFPEVEAATRVAPYYSDPSVKFDDKSFSEKDVIYADSNFFDVFSFRLLEGDKKTALSDPNTVVLTRSTAKRYFGDTPAIGRLITIDDGNNTFKVTGVVEDVPSNSHFFFNLIISASSNERMKETMWLNNWMYTYMVLREGADPTAVEAKFASLIPKYIGPEMERFLGISMDEVTRKGGHYGYFATKMTDIHLHATSRNQMEVGGNISHVYFFSGIGAFILLIACINFMNLSTARSAGRAKEVGLRKTLGSVRSQMIWQFLSESLIYSLVGVLVAVLACYFLLPYFNLLSGKQLSLEALATPLFIGSIVTLIIVVGVLSGSYPAFYLTSFNAVEVLKGKVRAGMKSKGVRSSLVVVQFFISILLIIFTGVVYQQVKYMQEKNMGFDKESIIVVKNTWRLGNNKEAFRNTLAQESTIEKLSYTNNNFPGTNSTTVFRAAGSDQDHIMGLYYADYEHLDVMKFEIAEGRFFSRDFPSDSTGIIINEAAAREFGYDQAVGEEIIFTMGEVVERYKVIGVVKNFNFESFKVDVRPLAIRLMDNAGNLFVRYHGEPTLALEAVEKSWKQHASNEPFEYSFLDEEFDSLFRAEERMGMVFTVFSGLAIFIACLGLFALAAFTAEQRTKEIGIRKALGASSTSLTLILSKEFTMLVIVAFVPAAAIGWYTCEQWLSGFVYRIEISPLLFILSGLSAISIAWLTVAYQAVKAASTNPVKALRYE